MQSTNIAITELVTRLEKLVDSKAEIERHMAKLPLIEKRILAVTVSIEILKESEDEEVLAVNKVSSRPSTFKALIISVLDQLRGEFTIKEVKDLLQTSYPDLANTKQASTISISSVLRDLAKDRSLEICKRGKGSNPSVYRRKEVLGTLITLSGANRSAPASPAK